MDLKKLAELKSETEKEITKALIKFEEASGSHIYTSVLQFAVDKDGIPHVIGIELKIADEYAD